MSRWIVQELVAGKWYNVRSFEKKEEADEFAKRIGRKARVKELKYS